MSDVNIGQLAATTLDKYQGKMVDNIFKSHALLNHLKNNGGTTTFSGGRKLVAPLMYGTNSTVQTFDGTDTLDTTYQDGIDAAEYDWKFYNASITFTLTDKVKNRGKEQVLSLLKSKVKQAENSLAERINSDLISGTDAKGLVGLDTLIGTTTTVGNISGSTNDWWRSYVDSDAEALAFADLRVAKNTAQNGMPGSRVSMILTTQALYEKMFSLLTATYEFSPLMASSKEGKRLADASFQVLEFEGIPVAYDESMTAGVVHLINKECYKLGILSDMNFKVVNKSEPSDQHVSLQHIVFGGAAFTDRRKGLAKLTAKTI